MLHKYVLRNKLHTYIYITKFQIVEKAWAKKEKVYLTGHFWYILTLKR